MVCGISQTSANWLKQSQDVMGTRVNVELWSENPASARHCSDQVFAEMHRIDALMSPYKPDSEISAINQQASEKNVSVSTELFNLLKQSIHFSELSSGAFDITFASIGFQYDYRSHKKPNAQTISQQLKTINYKNLVLENHTVKFAMQGMSIDLGGIAKGYAVDQAIEILQQCGIQQALVSAGGDSRILGDKQGRPWIIGIQHPRKKQAIALSIPLSNTAISTSGDYERFFLSNKKRIHHIINPQTGKSATKSWSATVIGPDATSTDALSTSIFILGAKKGLELINSLDNMDAIIIDSTGVVFYSSGLESPADPG
jgi:thiamine biosynthesis lipoprotein